MNDSGNQQELARDLGFLSAYTMGVGTMIGAGIFVLPSIAAANAGPASTISFVIGGIVSLLAALSLSELATGMPRAGGSYYYVNRSLGPFFGSIVGWGMWMGLMFATAFYMLGFGQYMTYFIGEGFVAYSALGMAALLVGVNFRGVKDAGALQNLIVVGLLGLIIVFVTFGVFQISGEALKPFNPHGWGAVASLAATLYVSFIGFEVIATSAEEIKEPGKNLPLAMLTSVLTPLALYVLVMLVSTGVLPGDKLAASKIPVADVAREYLGTTGSLMMVLGAILACVSSANASILSAARVNFAMGRDKILGDWLNEVHQRFRTPYRAIILTGVLILVMIAVGVGIETLADVASFSYLVTYALVHAAVIVMRRAAPPGYEPSFRIPGVLYPAVPIIGLVSCVVIALQMRPLVLAIGFGIMGLGALWYAFYARTRATETSLIGDAIVTQAPASEEKRFRVVVAVANPASESALLDLAASIARRHERPELVAVNVIEVPRQTALAQNLYFEKERVSSQQTLLDTASSIAESMGVPLRTRALLSHDVGSAILDVLHQEQADRLVVGWKGKRSRSSLVFGTNVDQIVAEAPCDVSLIKPTERGPGEIVGLVSSGPTSPIAAAQAHAFASAYERVPVLVNVQQPGERGAEETQQAGEAMIAEVAEKAGLSPEDYEPRVVIGEDIEQTLLEATAGCDTIFIGATRDAMLKQALFGSIPETMSEKSDSSVVIVSEEHRPRTIVEAIAERFAPRPRLTRGD